jgi:probable rRNA maturation factor
MTQRMILISTNHHHLRFPSKEVLRTLQTVYKGEEEELPSLAVVFTNDRYIKKINKTFLDHNYSTDVIAFSLGEDGGVEAEIYINLDAATKQAKTYGITFKKEVLRLLIHGALHLIGYRDNTLRLRNKMGIREDEYIQLLIRKVR